MKKTAIFMLSLALVAGMLSGCSGDSSDSSAKDSSSAADSSSVAETSAEDSTEDSSETSEEETMDDDENYDTGDASLDDIRNQDNIGDNELLVLSFGTSYNDSRRLTIGAIEGDLEKAFPDFSVRRGFTANIIIDHVQRRDNILIDDVDAALERAVNNGVKNLVVQPTHLMHGLEYDELVKEVGNYSDAFDQVVFGEPLLNSDDDFARVEKAITEWTASYDDGETAICFMGHGTEADSNEVYQKMQDLLTKDGYTNYFVGTVEAQPSLDDVLAKVQAGDYKRVVLEPLMVVAGDHANNDMAGDEDGSWKKTFEDAGYEVECLLRGLGENEDIRAIYVDHAKAAIDSQK
ncbi:sirohydrochlorin cobaltochelatase [uncultured Ruminococcus sp.]|uniref:sirohydrochlorin cobaltochelatase n=1 Tax=uncultured Ruminococcus sp. TaxID=165186 RepID=UPI002670E4A0|nr:sirohydrochlorin cobaltochelatase [uncultured Ruminococcus sp.]